MSAVIVKIFLVLVFVGIQNVRSEKDSLSVGFLFKELSTQALYPLNSTIHKKVMYTMPVEYSPVIQQISSTDSYEASKTLCNMIKADEGLAAVFGAENSPTAPIVESITTHFGIPYIMTSWSPPNNQEDRYTLNFFPHADIYAKALAEIVKSHQWTNFAILYETEEGLARMQEILKLQEFQKDGKRNRIIMKQLGSGPDYRPLLKKINSTEGNIILDCKTESIIPILEQAKSLKMLDLTDSYFLTSLDAHTLDFSVLDTTANITAIRLFDYNNEFFRGAIRRWEIMEFDMDPKRSMYHIEPRSIKTETALMQDAITLFTDSVNDLSYESSVQSMPVSCNGEGKVPDGGRINLRMKTRPITMPLTGPLSFDTFGNRIDFNIYLEEAISGETIATWHARNESITFARTMNETIDAAVLNLQKMTVIVSSKIGPPYLMMAVPKKGEVLVGNARYEGYSMDLIAGVAKIIGFKFEFHITEDNKNGNWDEQTRRWTGVIGDLMERRAHLGICDLTITHERREVVDFSMPFMNLGISILYKKPGKKDTNMFAFLDPFSLTVWIYTATLYLVVSIILFFISRMTPGDWENPHPCEEEPEELENMWGIKNCLWLTLGSIMTQGCDILPKGISSRMAVSMWWFFCLIMSSSYTANLAAFLTKANQETPIDGAEALSKQTKIKYGLMESGSTESFFRNSNLTMYQRMWQNMKEARPSVFVSSNKEGVARVQNTKNALYAFLMESTGIEYELQTRCDLKQIGNWLDSKSYGIAMPMNAPYRSAINKAVLKMAESGELGVLKKKWWEEQRDEDSCDEKDTDEEEDGELALAVANLGGAFVVLGIGIGLSYALALVEFLWNVRNVSVEEHISYWEALKVEIKFACSFWISRKRAKPLLSESSSGHSNKTDKTDSKSMEQSILRHEDSVHTS